MHQTYLWYENCHCTDVFLGLHPAHTYLIVNQKQLQERKQIYMEVKLESIFMPTVCISIGLWDLFDFLWLNTELMLMLAANADEILPELLPTYIQPRLMDLFWGGQLIFQLCICVSQAQTQQRTCTPFNDTKQCRARNRRSLLSYPPVLYPPATIISLKYDVYLSPQKSGF